MMINQLFDLYLDAYLSHSIDARIAFLKALNAFDYKTYRLSDELFYERWKQTIHSQSVQLFTNGSTKGKRQSYAFGPYEALLDIEELQKSKRIIVAGTTEPNRAKVLRKNQLIFKFDYDNPNFDSLQALLESNRYHIIARPLTYFFLAKQPKFLRLLNQVHSMLSTDWEPFFPHEPYRRLGIHINDCMIDWRTGLNFSTCVYGHQHILPIFILYKGAIYNWLNLASKEQSPIYDTLIINSLKPIQCVCGKWRLGVTIKTRGDLMFPHNWARLLNRLESNYKNLQIIRDREKLSIFYAGAMNDKDRDLLLSEFQGHKIQFLENKLAIVGVGKWSGFWDTRYGPAHEKPFKFF